MTVLTRTCKTLRSLLLPPEANSVGQLALMDESSLSIEQVVYKLTDNDSGIDGVILLENELEVMNEAQLNCLKETDKTIICLDHSDNQITALADIVFPAAPITESDGHFVNYQGQIQAFYQVHPSVLPVQENWRWLTLIAKAMYPKHALSQEVHSLSELHQLFHQHDDYWPITKSATYQANAIKPIAREPHRASGRTAKMANISVHEAKVSQSEGDYRFSMEGSDLNHATEMPFTWSPGWNSNQSIHQYQQKVAGHLTHQADALFFDFNQIKAVIERRAPLSEHQQCFHSQIPWHRSGWQSGLNPEFALLHKVNKIFMSSTEIAKRKLVENHWVSVDLTAASTGEKRQYIAQLLLDENLLGDLIYGDIDQLPNQIYSKVAVSIASAHQVEKYQNQCQHLQQKATQDKALILEKLKAQDAYIPIRLVSGGLDNA